MANTDIRDTKAGRPFSLTPDQISEVVKLKAMGYPQTALAKLHGVSPPTISRYLKSPEALAELAEWREIFRHQMLQRTAGLVDKVANAVKDADGAKNVDAATRALLNLEKASASASGEAKRVEMTGPEGAPMQFDIRAILARAVQGDSQ